MGIRLGPLPTVAFVVGLAGSADAWRTPSPTAGVASHSASPFTVQGERPRQDDNTKAAQHALEQADSATETVVAHAFYEQALGAARAAISADESNPLAHYQAGVAALGLERYQESDAYLDRAVALWPVYSLEIAGIREGAWIRLYQEAVPLVNEGRNEQAVALLEQADVIYDQRPEVKMVLGRIYAQIGQHDEALSRLDQAMAIIRSGRAQEVDSATMDEWQAQALEISITKATLLAAVGRYDEAASLFRDLAAQDPADVMLARNLGTILVETGDHEEAFRIFDELMTRSGLSSQDYYQIGIGYYRGAAWDRAAQAFGEAVERSVRDRDALAMWARSLQAGSAWRELPPAVERWVELDPHNEQAYLILAQATNEIGDVEQAHEVIARVEELEVHVGNLQISRRRSGGAAASGSLTNMSLEPGTAVTLLFTFFDARGERIGTAEHRVSAGQRGVVEPFQVLFESDQWVAGYGYEVTIAGRSDGRE